MKMKSLFGMLGVAAGLALAGTVAAQDAAAPPADAAPAADAAPPAADAAPAPEAAAPAPAADAAAAPEPAPAEAPAPVASSSSNTTTEQDENETAVTFGRPLYVSPMFNYTFADKLRRGKNGIGGSFAIGSRLLDFAAVEAQANYTSFKNDSTYGGSSKLTGFGANLLIFPLVKVLPNFYVIVGGEYAHNKSQPVTESDGTTIDKRSFGGGAFSGGLGYWQPFSVFGIKAAARLEATYRANQHKNFNQLSGRAGKDNFEDTLLSAGFVIPLFASTPTPAPPPPAEAPAVVPVAEAPPPPAEAPPPPPPAPGCRTPIAGEKVDLSGCASGDVIVLRGVNFDFNKATLTVNARTILDQVADALKAAPDIKVEIGGHTDGKGSVPYNQKLSQKRADAVKAYLVEHGVAADRMTTMGYGKSHPIADNATDEGREQNRRVELKVMG